MRLAWATVSSVSVPRDGILRLSVAFDDGSEGSAVCYPRLGGICIPGDRVLVNTTAVDLALGTGGEHFVVARAQREGDSAVVADVPSGGHVMKLRYTPLQVDVLAVESPESADHEVLEGVTDVGGMPVVCCGLHSQLPLAAAALKEAAPDSRIAYVMTDEAALPVAFSDLVAGCLEAGLVDETVTCGQAFGGRIEAVNLHSGLLAARHVAGADAAIVSIGPGVVGTATPFGHGGVAQGEAINAAASVGGRPVAALRISFADTRERHRGLSHHSVVALTRVALSRALVAVPGLAAEQAAVIEDDLERAGVWSRHERADVPGARIPDLRGVRVRSMGRTPADDPAFFAAAAAAGTVAGSLAGHGS